MDNAMLVLGNDGPMATTHLVKTGLSSPNSRPTGPTVKGLTDFMASFFPIRPRDVPFSYHTPRAEWFNHETTPVTHVVLSVTPTAGIYNAINKRGQNTAVAFLHRPWNLERHRVRRGCTVLSSHVGFDEVLTVGWNTELASRLGVEVAQSACLQGYKGDPGRRIGLVGPVDSSAHDLAERIKSQFSNVEATFGVDQEQIQPIKVVAIMNAFHPEEVDRVLATAHEHGWIDELSTGSEILYLTGAVREPGLIASQEKGFKVVCVGHQSCEEWGIACLANRIRSEWPSLDVVEIYEDEPPPPPKEPKRKKTDVAVTAEGSEKGPLPLSKQAKSETSSKGESIGGDSIGGDSIDALIESTAGVLDTSVAAQDTDEGGVKI